MRKRAVIGYKEKSLTAREISLVIIQCLYIHTVGKILRYQVTLRNLKSIYQMTKIIEL